MKNVVGLNEIFKELMNWDWNEIHYFEGGFFIGFIIGWCIGWFICVYCIQHGLGLKIKNFLRKRKTKKIENKKWG